MKIYVSNQQITVVLSRRNLNALIAKLDGFPPNSSRTIAQIVQRGLRCEILAEEDSAHYDRQPGTMHPSTEGRLERTQETT